MYRDEKKACCCLPTTKSCHKKMVWLWAFILYGVMLALLCYNRYSTRDQLSQILQHKDEVNQRMSQMKTQAGTMKNEGIEKLKGMRQRHSNIEANVMQYASYIYFALGLVQVLAGRRLYGFSMFLVGLFGAFFVSQSVIINLISKHDLLKSWSVGAVSGLSIGAATVIGLVVGAVAYRCRKIAFASAAGVLAFVSVYTGLGMIVGNCVIKGNDYMVIVYVTGFLIALKVFHFAYKAEKDIIIIVTSASGSLITVMFGASIFLKNKNALKDVMNLIKGIQMEDTSTAKYFGMAIIGLFAFGLMSQCCLDPLLCGKTQKKSVEKERQNLVQEMNFV